ncbi:MAG: 4'-phosphopantetheinyl transferase [Bacteroidetes bacterium]|nr:4'-phosphopantetheinyl transferase [Bacteroidota bacterium]
MIKASIDNNGMYILLWELTETTEELELMLTRPELYKAEYKLIKNKKRQYEFLATRVALKHLLKKEVEIEYDDDGKPGIRNDKREISITHSGQWVAVMVHSSKRCGIDVEKPTEKFGRLYTRFLSLEEQQYLFDEQDLTKVQLAWSAKEALFKIIGHDAVDFATQLRIEPFEINTHKLKATHIPTNRVYHLHFEYTNEYSLVYGTD